MDMHRRETLRDLEEDLGYLFEDTNVLDRALTHKSYANERGDDVLLDDPVPTRFDKEDWDW